MNLEKRDIIIFAIIGLCVFLLPILFTQTWSGISFKDTGAIGDTIGGITAPFLSFFGSILVYMALKAQIDANREINEQFQAQKKIDYKQNFESTFFNLLNIHHKIVESIDMQLKELVYKHTHIETFIKSNHNYSQFLLSLESDETFTSRDAFKLSASLLRNFLHDDIIFNNNYTYTTRYRSHQQMIDKNKFFNQIKFFKKEKLSINNHTIENNFMKIYQFFYIKYNTDLGHYFRNLYRILKIIDEAKFEDNSQLDYDKKYFYTSILRAQLSDFELLWLFFNCIHTNGREKLKPLIEKYTILKNMDKENDVFKFYSPFFHQSAFEKPRL